MTSYADEELLKYADRVKGKTVVITGGANGIGREAAIRFGKAGAHVVIGDLNAGAAAATLKDAGGDGLTLQCDVTSWEDTVHLFSSAYARYGSVDVVVASAGVTEIGHFETFSKEDGERPSKPVLKTLDINLTGSIYTARAALFYLRKKRTEGDVKALIFLGSIASWQAIAQGSMYSASKHAILGLMRAMHLTCVGENIRFASLHPFFADTAIVPKMVKVALAGIPKTPVSRIAESIVYIATDPVEDNNGCPWLLPDDGLLYRLDREQLKEGVYDMINQRVKKARENMTAISVYVATIKDLTKVLGPQVLGLSALVAGGVYAYRSYSKL